MIIPATRVEVEMSMVWAHQNPDLFVKATNDFARDYHWRDYQHKIDFSREGFVTLTAVRRESQG